MSNEMQVDYEAWDKVERFALIGMAVILFIGAVLYFKNVGIIY